MSRISRLLMEINLDGAVYPNRILKSPRLFVSFGKPVPTMTISAPPAGEIVLGVADVIETGISTGVTAPYLTNPIVFSRILGK